MEETALVMTLHEPGEAATCLVEVWDTEQQ